jgi:hypothetical protein
MLSITMLPSVCTCSNYEDRQSSVTGLTPLDPYSSSSKWKDVGSIIKIKYKNIYTVKLTHLTFHTHWLFTQCLELFITKKTLASLLFALVTDRATTTFAVSFHKPVKCDRLLPTVPGLWNKPYGTNTEKQIAITTKCLA